MLYNQVDELMIKTYLNSLIKKKQFIYSLKWKYFITQLDPSFFRKGYTAKLIGLPYNIQILFEQVRDNINYLYALVDKNNHYIIFETIPLKIWDKLIKRINLFQEENNE